MDAPASRAVTSHIYQADAQKWRLARGKVNLTQIPVQLLAGLISVDLSSFVYTDTIIILFVIYDSIK